MYTQRVRREAHSLLSSAVVIVAALCALAFLSYIQNGGIRLIAETAVILAALTILCALWIIKSSEYIYIFIGNEMAVKQRRFGREKTLAAIFLDDVTGFYRYADKSRPDAAPCLPCHSRFHKSRCSVLYYHCADGSQKTLLFEPDDTLRTLLLSRLSPEKNGTAN